MELACIILAQGLHGYLGIPIACAILAQGLHAGCWHGVCMG